MKNPLALALSLLAAMGVYAEDDKERLLKALFPHPALTQPGACVVLKEGGAGWLLREPTYWLKGTVIGSELRSHPMGSCPSFEGKSPERYSREEYIRYLKAQPCQTGAPREVMVGVLRMQVSEWETPYARRAANTGRLFQGAYLDVRLAQGAVLEIPADLLVPCDAGE